METGLALAFRVRIDSLRIEYERAFGHNGLFLSATLVERYRTKRRSESGNNMFGDTMVKVIWLVPRRPGVTHERFVDRYLVHAPNITKLFGHLVQQYRVDFINETFKGLNRLGDDMDPVAAPTRRQYDSVTQMAFWNQSAWDESLNIKPEVAAQLAASESSWIDASGVINLFVDEHNLVQRRNSRAKAQAHVKTAIWLLKRKPGVARASFRELYLRQASTVARLIGHLTEQYQVNFVNTEFVGEQEGKSKDPFKNNRSLEPAYDAVTSMTFPDANAWDQALQILRHPDVAKQIDEAESHYLDRAQVVTYFVDPHIYVPEGLPDVTVHWE
jgi:hypothetical protein